MLSAAVVGLSLGISGCATPAPTAAPSSPAVTPTPTPTPTPVAEPELRVVLTTLSVDVYADDVLTDSWVHTDRDPAEIPGLTEAFGSEPVVTETTQPGEGAPNTYQHYTWPGFDLYFIISEYGDKHVRVTATAASVGDVAVEAVGGIRVGDDAQAIASAYPEYSSTVDFADGLALRTGVDAVPSGIEGYDGPGADFVAVVALEPFDVVTSLATPSKNYGL